MNLKMTVILVIVAILAILAIGGSIVYFWNTYKPRITAMEGKSIADQTALKWSSTAVSVWAVSSTINYDGRASSWSYEYASEPSLSGKGLYITVTSDFAVTTSELKFPVDYIPITNWSIDSTDAVNIAKANSTIKEYLSTYSDAKISRMDLVSHYPDNISCVWIVEWNSPGLWDNPHWAEVRIDATTGKILMVEADLEGPPVYPWYYPTLENTIFVLCILPPLSICIVILVAVSVWKIWKKWGEKERKQAYQELKQKWEEKK